MQNSPLPSSVIKSLIATPIIIISIVLLSMYVSTHNSEARLRNQFTAQQKLNEATFDNVWKTIQQQTQVASYERDSFRETFTEIMEAQRGVAGNGSLASFFQQANVQVTPDLFKQLMVTIEAQRAVFLDSQKNLLQIKNNHDNLITQYPSALFVGGRPPLEAVIVTSAKTDEAFRTGAEDDIDLFK